MTVMGNKGANAETVTASSRKPNGFCTVLTQHIPRDDVTYKPNAARPADIRASSFDVPDETVFPLTVDLREFFGANIPAGVDLEPDLGLFRIKKDGRVFWNETDMTGQAFDYCGIEAAQPNAPVVVAPQKPVQPAPLAEVPAPEYPQPLVKEEETIYGAFPE